MCTNKYSNKERYDKVIAKTKWCSFLCLTVYNSGQNTDKFSLIAEKIYQICQIINNSDADYPTVLKLDKATVMHYRPC